MKNKKQSRKILYIIILLAFIFIGFRFFQFYNKIYATNVKNEKVEYDLYIATGSNFDQVIENIKELNCITDLKDFIWVAKKMNYPAHIYPGHYVILKKMNNRDIVKMLRSGEQKPIKLTFNNIKNIKKLASTISTKIEADSESIYAILSDSSFISKIGFTKTTILGLFIPNTYEFYWNTSSKSFIEKMEKEYKKFWTEERIAKARNLNFSKNDVSTLASIVNEETVKKSEMPTVAGVYINRIKKRMRLQADPTIRFVVGDSIKRILTKHLTLESPYNTYINYGLPPGPISVPSIDAIDAVLNYEKHEYLFFCAKEDFSGYHYFAKTLSQHNHYARMYQDALNKNKIWR